MGSLEKLCLRWNDFGKNVSRSFATIRANNKFFDCTLTTDDDDIYSDGLRAHKVILSATSELLKKILEKESLCTNPNPVVYLKGFSAKQLKLILGTFGDHVFILSQTKILAFNLLCIRTSFENSVNLRNG